MLERLEVEWSTLRHMSRLLFLLKKNNKLMKTPAQGNEGYTILNNPVYTLDIYAATEIVMLSPCQP